MAKVDYIVSLKNGFSSASIWLAGSHNNLLPSCVSMGIATNGTVVYNFAFPESASITYRAVRSKLEDLQGADYALKPQEQAGSLSGRAMPHLQIIPHRGANLTELADNLVELRLIDREMHGAVINTDAGPEESEDKEYNLHYMISHQKQKMPVVKYMLRIAACVVASIFIQPEKVPPKDHGPVTKSVEVVQGR